MKLLDKIIKSPNDPLDYIAYQLQNDLKVVFIEDKGCKISSAVMNVDIGGFDDPLEYQGLAHFLEHMLFMGSEKYPDENEFSEFISLNGGEQNAWTNFTATTYYFTINGNQFDKGLDIFSRFFIDPLFKQEFVDKELNAVDSEHQKDFYVDDWRFQQVMSEVSHEKSLLRRFLNGSLQTLKKDNIYQKLKKFHQEKYSANLMTLVVYHNKIDEQFINYVNETFNQINNTNLAPKNYAQIQRPFDSSNTSKYIQFKSIQKQKKIYFIWFMEQQQQYYRSPPLKILAHILGHESEGTLYKILFDKHFIYDLLAISYNCDDYYSEFTIEIHLTQDGFDNKKEVISIVSGYIQMLQESGIPQWIFEELKTVAELNFLYKPKQSSVNKSLKIAEMAATYPISEINKIGYLFENFDEDYLQKILKQFNIENLLLVESSNTFGQFRFQEPHYNMTYECEDIPQVYKDIFSSKKNYNGYGLPPQNHFLPQNFDIIESSENQKFPQKIHEEFDIGQSTGVLFHLPDNKFRLPKIEIQYALYTIEHTENISKQQLYNQLWKDICQQHINNFIYLADMAYIRLHITCISRGFQIECNGYSDKLPTFMVCLAEKIKEFRTFQDVKYLEELFDKFKKKMILKIDKLKKKPAYKQTLKAKNYVVQDNQQSPSDQLKMLKEITFEEYLRFHREALKTFHYQGLVLGNINVEQCLDFNSKFMKNLYVGNQNFGQLQIRNIKLKKNKTYIYRSILENKKAKNSCVLIAYEMKRGLENYCLCSVLDHIFESSFFDNLRTQKQLGYIVFSVFTQINKVPYMHFLVQSNRYSSVHCSQQIIKYLQEFKKELEEIIEEKFQQVKDSMIANLQKKFNNLREESNFYFEQILKKDYNFGIREDKIKIIKEITKEQVQQFYQKYFEEKKKHFEIHLINEKSKDKFDQELQKLQEDNDNKIILFEDYKKLKRKSALHPDYFF